MDQEEREVKFRNACGEKVRLEHPISAVFDLDEHEQRRSPLNTPVISTA